MSSEKLFRHYIGIAWRSTLAIPTLHEGVVVVDVSPPLLERAPSRTGAKTVDALIAEVRWVSAYSGQQSLPQALPLAAEIVSPSTDPPREAAPPERRATRPRKLEFPPVQRDLLEELEDALFAGTIEQASELFELMVETEREGAALRCMARYAGNLAEALRVRAATLLLTRDEGGALELLTAGPLTTPEARLLESDLRKERGELEGALRAAESALARNATIVGGKERVRSLRELLERTRQLVRPHASKVDASAALDKAGRLISEGRRAQALIIARSALALTSDARLAELTTELELGLATKRSLIVKQGDEVWHVVDADSASIGRVGADVVIPSPLVSREHLRVVVAADETRILELGSRNGTSIGGQHLTGSIPVSEGRELVLGGSIPCVIAPLDPGARRGPIRIETPAAEYIVTMGQPIIVGPWKLERARREDLSCWVLTSLDGATLLSAAKQSLSRVELLVGDRWKHPTLAQLYWLIDADEN